MNPWTEDGARAFDGQEEVRIATAPHRLKPQWMRVTRGPARDFEHFTAVQCSALTTRLDSDEASYSDFSVINLFGKRPEIVAVSST